ncbi:MAG: hypothetical protein H0W73_06440 [Bacteroidetes bacterium]|nr:hypothetical protein [Bacteroidota bacterium]
MFKKEYLKIVFCFVAVLFICSCKKTAGEGGFASIEGKLYVKNYDATFTVLTSEYYLPGETVYIIYGDGQEIGNTVKTSYDGSFKFNYLQKGKYKVYAIGKDETKPSLSIPKESLMEVTITEKKQKKVLEDIVIID